jgi:alginate O-acetyltransferase complex protein AlgI
MMLLSFGFLIFLTIVFILYWSVFQESAKSQNILLSVSSLIFYGMADWHLLFILIFSILFNFYTARLIARNTMNERPYFLLTGLIINIGVLAYFKFSGFFYAGITSMLGINGNSYDSLHIILPIGISFYTFQAIGYIIDVYNDRISPCCDLLTFTTFISYFPKMTAGPIEPAEHFLGQIEKKREFKYHCAVDGLRQILWGFFVKLVIADNCASIARPIFDNYMHLPASTLLTGAFFYLFQVYADFSGYSNMAIGISKLFGIQLMRNFASPFFATNISEYWKRWNISLSSWMMRYVFYPLSFTLRKFEKPGLIFSIIITFLIIGLWHGAKYTFIVFGLLHGLYFIPVLLAGKINREEVSRSSQLYPEVKDIFKMAGVFVLAMITIIVFGAENIRQAFHYIAGLFSFSIFSAPVFPDHTGYLRAIVTLFFILIMMSVEWIQRNKKHEMQLDSMKSSMLRIGIYYAITLAIFLCGSEVHIDFIYSQF